MATTDTNSGNPTVAEDGGGAGDSVMNGNGVLLAEKEEIEETKAEACDRNDEVRVSESEAARKVKKRGRKRKMKQADSLEEKEDMVDSVMSVEVAADASIVASLDHEKVEEIGRVSNSNGDLAEEKEIQGCDQNDESRVSEPVEAVNPKKRGRKRKMKQADSLEEKEDMVAANASVVASLDHEKVEEIGRVSNSNGDLAEEKGIQGCDQNDENRVSEPVEAVNPKKRGRKRKVKQLDSVEEEEDVVDQEEDKVIHEVILERTARRTRTNVNYREIEALEIPSDCEEKKKRATKKKPVQKKEKIPEEKPSIMDTVSKAYDLAKNSAADENGEKPGFGPSNMCHQCQRNDKGRVVRCRGCVTKRYCVPCMTTWYE